MLDRFYLVIGVVGFPGALGDPLKVPSLGAVTGV